MTKSIQNAAKQRFSESDTVVTNLSLIVNSNNAIRSNLRLAAIAIERPRDVEAIPGSPARHRIEPHVTLKAAHINMPVMHFSPCSSRSGLHQASTVDCAAPHTLAATL